MVEISVGFEQGVVRNKSVGVGHGFGSVRVTIERWGKRNLHISSLKGEQGGGERV